jgi:hypothetical protein
VHTDTDVVTVLAGALPLFGREEALRRFLPTHEAAFQVLRGLAVEVNDFFRWPLFRLAEEMLARFTARNTEEEIQLGLLRVAVPAYSTTALPHPRPGGCGRAVPGGGASAGPSWRPGTGRESCATAEPCSSCGALAETPPTGSTREWR